LSFTGQVTPGGIGQAVPDGVGGALIVWVDTTPPDEGNIFAQRVSAEGVPLWNPAGVPVCDTVALQLHPSIAADGTGGAFVFWDDDRNSASLGRDIYAQRVSAAGATLWGSNGVAIASALRDQHAVAAVSDGTGGAIAAWEDNRAVNSSFRSDIFAQRVTPSGTPSPGWTPGGVGVCLAIGPQHSPSITPDNAGGAIVAWQDWRTSSSSADIYARRVTASGTAGPWPGDGLLVCNATFPQEWPVIVSDGTGGAIITWDDSRDVLSTNVDIYAQRVSSVGALHWTGNGVAVTAAPGEQTLFDSEFDGVSVAHDGASGAFVAWEDRRAGSDIYATHVQTDGVPPPSWVFDGTAICSAAETQQNPTIALDGVGGAIIAWEDRRGTSPQDIYAQRVTSSGSVRWASDGVPIAAGPGSQQAPILVSDGAGGALLVYLVAPFVGGFGDVYVQRIDSLGAFPPPVDVAPIPPVASIELGAPQPNPCSGGEILVPFAIQSTERVTARVVDALGRIVRALDSRVYPSGTHGVRWDGLDEQGHRSPPGLHFLQVSAGPVTKTQKVIILH
jgi:hypothetical protein